MALFELMEFMFNQSAWKRNAKFDGISGNCTKITGPSRFIGFSEKFYGNYFLRDFENITIII